MENIKLSIIIIGKSEDEFKKLERSLENQTYRNFELITSTKGTIPEAWNDAISRANGDFFIFTETDALPLNNNWLEDISRYAEKNSIIKGLEINPSDLNLCNLVCDSSIFEKIKFDETYSIAEDTEFFAHSRNDNIEIKRLDLFPVIHYQRKTWKKMLSRSLKYGMSYMKIIYKYGRGKIDDVNTKNVNAPYIHPVSYRIMVIIENILVLSGLMLGALLYLPYKIKK